MYELWKCLCIDLESTSFQSLSDKNEVCHNGLEIVLIAVAQCLADTRYVHPLIISRLKNPVWNLKKRLQIKQCAKHVHANQNYSILHLVESAHQTKDTPLGEANPGGRSFQTSMDCVAQPRFKQITTWPDIKNVFAGTN